MTAQALMAFGVYALVTLITPGPNNIMLLTSGVNFGLSRSLPHISGVAGGLAFMVFVVGLGFSVVFEMFPASYIAIQYIGAAYLLYLAWKVANSGPVSVTGEENADRKPMSFFSAVLFQWVNPKAWMVAAGAISLYVPHEHYTANVFMVALVFCLLGIPCAGLWAACGTVFRRILENEKYVRIFNILMALLLLTSLYPVLTEILNKPI